VCSVKGWERSLFFNKTKMTGNRKRRKREKSGIEETKDRKDTKRGSKTGSRLKKNEGKKKYPAGVRRTVNA